jgi:hypothetical protein
MSGQLPPLHQLTPDDRGGLVIIVAYFLVSVTVVLSYIRYSLSTANKLPYKLDDFAIIFATVGFVRFLRAS